MDTLIQKLRVLGIAVTPQRLAVMEILENRRDHPTAEKIYQEVRGRLPTISFNTVYKTLEVLYHKGLILKVNPLHEVAHYDGTNRPHAHLICRRCHRITDLDRQLPEGEVLPPEDLRGFRVERQYLTLWGLCQPCQQQESQENPKEA